MNQSWMSRHATEHKSNLLNEMPVDNKASALNKLKTYNPEPPKKAKEKVIKGVAGKRINMNDDSPMSKLGCGGEGCVRKRGDQWVILNNKKAGYPVWRSGLNQKLMLKKCYQLIMLTVKNKKNGLFKKTR